MEKKVELKNCKIFNKKGRILRELLTEAIVPITISGKHRRHYEIIY